MVLTKNTKMALRLKGSKLKYYLFFIFNKIIFKTINIGLKKLNKKLMKFENYR